MRCTRCDGLVVPQAVGIDPEGKVVFGWCVHCLADRGCKLVETSPPGPWNFAPPPVTLGPSEARERRPLTFSVVSELDQTQWIVAIVAFLMMSWGLMLVAAGSWSAKRSSLETSPLGNGTPALLLAGGALTALLGVIVLILASRRNWYPGTFLLAFLSWLSFLLTLGILLQGIVDYQPRRNVVLVFAAGLSLGVAVLTRMVHRSQSRKLSSPKRPAVRKPTASAGKSRAADWRRLV
jgi:hypothetical protein